MIHLHAIWDGHSLHLWGFHVRDGADTPDTASLPSKPTFEASGGVGTARRSRKARKDTAPSVQRIRPTSDNPTNDVRLLPEALTEHELRQCCGDRWDSLLISTATASTLTLTLPTAVGVVVPEPHPPVPESESVEDIAQSAANHLFTSPTQEIEWHAAVVPTLCLAPAETMDLLTSMPVLSHRNPPLLIGTSIRFWSRAATLVLEQLAAQRFVPDVFHRTPAGYEAFWRVLVRRGDALERINRLVAAMPGVCTSFQRENEALCPAVLVDRFLWATVNALVRRCMEGDELVAIIHNRSRTRPAPLIRWLEGLVGKDARIHGRPDECAALFQGVRRWLAGVEPTATNRACRTCFKLQAPSEASEQQLLTAPWRLTLHLQATADPELMIDAAEVWHSRGDHPRILLRTFEEGPEVLREDLARAARHFEPLAACLTEDHPQECLLSLEDAYRFLRDASPVLKIEGFGILLPRWWRQGQPQPGVQLVLKPAATTASGVEPTIRLDALVEYDWRIALGDTELTPEEITALAEQKSPLVRLRGRWTEVHAAELKAAAAFLARKGAGQMTLMEALRWAYLAEDGDTGVPVLGVRATGWIDDFLNATYVNQPLERLSPPTGFAGTLRPYQLRGLEWLRFLSRHGLGACLADDMGLGKTIQLIALFLKERENAPFPGPTLLVVPMSLVGNWQREIARFGPSLRVLVHHGLDRLTGESFVREAQNRDVVISTYGLVHRDSTHLGNVKWYRVALDEAQNIKNPAAKQARAVRLLQATHRVALTGTPVENHLNELWSILDFLNPGYMGAAADFRRRFAVPIERHHDTQRTDRLKELIRPFVLRRVKSDPAIAADLPERMEMKTFCNLTAEQAALYEAVVRDMLGQIDRTGGIQRRGLILAALVRLKQICNHPAQFLADGSPLAHRSGKTERLREMLEEVVAEGDRALVFTQFRTMGQLLQTYLQDRLACEVIFLHGGTPQPERVAIVERFQAQHTCLPVFVLSLKAGGFGLNLTAANHVFLFDRWWNPAVEEQAADRTHRIGQQRQVQVHKFVCAGTVEERIDAMIDRKRDLAQRIVGTGEDWLTELSTDALRDVFALSREAVVED